jgi:hypothetical protein
MLCAPLRANFALFAVKRNRKGRKVRRKGRKGKLHLYRQMASLDHAYFL